MQLSNNTILITGGASGIGLGLTERFLQEQNKVIICGRRAAALDAVKEKFPTVITKVCDIAVEAERIDLFNWVATNHKEVNVLVNNAGIQHWMHIDDPSFYTKATAEITTNIVAPIHLTSLFTQLPSFTTVINVTSGLAFVQLAKVPVYCATKAFFHSFTQSLRYMLQSKNIEVIELIPPALNTDLGGKGLHDGQPPVSDFIEAIFSQLKEGKNTATFGFSEVVSNANPTVVQEIFKKMNP